MPIYMIIPRYSHNYAQFYQLINSNSFTHRKILVLLREATSETYGPGVYLHHISLPILSYFLCFFTLLLFYFASLSQKYQKYYLIISIRSHSHKWPCRDWQPLIALVARIYLFCAGARDSHVAPTGLIPWFSKTEGNTYATLLHHPFLFKGKPTQCSRGSTLLFVCCFCKRLTMEDLWDTLDMTRH